jgi:hypothetical protein
MYLLNSMDFHIAILKLASHEHMSTQSRASHSIFDIIFISAEITSYSQGIVTRVSSCHMITTGVILFRSLNAEIKRLLKKNISPFKFSGVLTALRGFRDCSQFLSRE